MDYSNSGTSTTYHSGTVYGSGGDSATYSGTSTTYNNNTGQALANLGKSIQRQNLFNDCMRGQGYELKRSTTESYSADYYVSSRNKSSAGGVPVPQDPADPSKFQKPLDDWDEGPTSINFAIITKQGAEIKTQPALKAPGIVGLKEGDVVEVFGEAAYSWLKIGHHETFGFVLKRWVKPTDRTPEGEFITASEVAERLREKNEKYYAHVRVAEAAVRSGPGHDAPLIGVIEQGTELIVPRGTEGDWIQVRFDSAPGFIQKSNITFGRTKSNYSR